MLVFLKPKTPLSHYVSERGGGRVKRNFINKNRTADKLHMDGEMLKIKAAGGIDYFDYEYFVDTKKESLYNLFEMKKFIKF